MRNILLSILLIFSFSVSIFALDASVSFCTFKGTEQNYVEVYMHFVGETIKHKETTGNMLQAGVGIMIVFKQEENIVKYDKFNLQSPIVEKRKDFIDLKRYGLPDGNYQLVVDITDLENSENKRQFSTPIAVGYEAGEIQQSDIQLLASIKSSEEHNNPLVKNGVEMEPLPFNYYPRHNKELTFYQEIYNSLMLENDFFISFSVQNASDKDTGKAISTGYKRLEPAAIIPVLQKVDISTLPSGNYLLNIEVRNRDKDLLSQKAVFFQRSNPAYDTAPAQNVESIESQFVSLLTEEELEYSIRAISLQVPSDAEMLNTIIAEGKTEAMKVYLLSFWSKQDPDNTEETYSKYMEVARAVDNMFDSGFGHGFETDRGLIYMKYGRPDDIIAVEDEPSAPPYEIWLYNEFPKTHQNNVRFLFYNPSLSPGNFQLLHSTARTERFNPRWQVDLYQDDNADPVGGNYIDGTQANDGFGRRAAEYFNDF